MGKSIAGRRVRSLASGSWWWVAGLAFFALWTAIAPFERAFFRVEINYNEGWNIYNASLLTSHRPLYPVQYGWTTINYPMLSFALLAQLHRLTHEYLFTARAISLVSLLVFSVLAAAIVRRLTRMWQPALLAGFFCLAVFCAAGDYPAYVGMDDPQFLAQAFFMAGLYVYIASNRSWRGTAWTALLFVLAMCIKHNLIEFPLAVLADLVLLSVARAAWFSLCGGVLGAVAVALQVHYGGPYFVDAMLAPRAYSTAQMLQQFGVVLGPLVLPLGVAGYTAWRDRSDSPRRVLGLLFTLSLLGSLVFGGGEGVSVNAYFGVFLAMTLLVGLSFGHVLQPGQDPAPEPGKAPWRLTGAQVPLAVFAWLLVPWLVVPPLSLERGPNDQWNPVAVWQRLSAEQRRFDAETALLRAQQGPALCESMLRCYFAGKPYVYDPFNATRFIHLRKLDPGPVVAALRDHRYGTVQLGGSLADQSRSVFFAQPILAAIRQNYRSVMQNEDGLIYVPSQSSASAAVRLQPPVPPVR
jgi:hypothetical protein